jgi:hypothetical protein
MCLTRVFRADLGAVLKELRIHLVGPKEKARWNRLVREHHYLKSADLVGEQVTLRRGRPKGSMAGAFEVERGGIASQSARPIDRMVR